jgi:23S rRNA (cytosine1962-C5)-methyltransferase
VIQLDSPAVEPWLDVLTRAILGTSDGLRRVVLRPRGRKSGQPGSPLRALAGPPLEDPLIIQEHGLRFEVDIARGHKTGFYLDQRENRRRIRDLAAGRRALNLFAYTGGFSVAAAAGGAVAVTSVDISRPVIEAARRNVALNGWEAREPDLTGLIERFAGPPAFRFVAADAFEFLKQSTDAFDLVVVDPPSMAPSKAALDAALASYRKLNVLALARVAPGGLLFTASCSSHVTADHLRDVVGAAAGDARREVRILESGGAGPDHPTLPGFAEGGYLKTLLLFVA